MTRKQFKASTQRQPSAGIGDPYFYEWTVALRYIIDMLNPDNRIASVTIQKFDVRGWDDVVVEYEDGHQLGIQVKHTRSDDTFSMSNLVTLVDHQSFLEKLARGWKEIPFNANSKFSIFTNREATSGTQTLPPLGAFFEELKKNLVQSKPLDALIDTAAWQPFYRNTWLQQLRDLDDNEKRQFQQQFEIKTSQPNLTVLEDQIREAIARTFGISGVAVEDVFASFTHALREWVTTRRMNDRITAETVWQKLSPRGASTPTGEHDLVPPEPFFESRQAILDEIRLAFQDAQKKVIFLVGTPGSGKTSLVSKLFNLREREVHLRYFTFRPISPDNDLLPPDTGLTSQARSLWGDLLIQLREQLKGELALHKVPLRADFIPDVQQLRDHVIRLAVTLSKKLKRRIVICIDGIDHAARAEISGAENYLNSLIPPDNIPSELQFLIAGQPPDSYEKYPNWLQECREDIARIDLRNLNLDDISLMIPVSRSHERSFLAKIVFDHTGGNTLAVLYAIKTIEEELNAADVLTQLEKSKLKDGLKTYYKNIWDNCFKQLATIPLLGEKVATVLSITASRLTGGHFHKLFPEIVALNEADWNLILRRASPLLQNNRDGIFVLHNDVRVYLTTRVMASTPELYKEISNSLRSLYFGEDRFIRQRHNELVGLLKKGSNEPEILSVLTPKFVVEAFVVESSRQSVNEQLALAAEQAVAVQSFDALHNVVCCIETMDRIESSLSNINSSWEHVDLTRSSADELRVLPKPLWTLEAVDSALDTALGLFRAGELDRGFGLFQRWFDDLGLVELVSLLPERDALHKNQRSEEIDFSQPFTFVLEKFGKLASFVGWPSLRTGGEEVAYSRLANAHMFKGAVSEGWKIESDIEWSHFINSLSGVHFTDEFGALLNKAVSQKNWIRAARLVKDLGPDHLLAEHHNLAYLVALLCDKKRLIVKWKRDRDAILSSIRSEQFMRDHEFKYFRGCLAACVIGWTDGSLDIGQVIDLISGSTFDSNGDMEYEVGSRLLFRCSALLGRWKSEINMSPSSQSFVCIDDSGFKDLLSTLFSFRERHVRALLYLTESLDLLFKFAVSCAKEAGGKYFEVLKDMLASRYSERLVYDTWFLLTIELLHDAGFSDQCKIMIERVIGKSGKIWLWEHLERNNILDDFRAIQKYSEYQNLYFEAVLKNRWFVTGFSSHKEYSLYSEQSWLSKILENDSKNWRVRGCNLMALSKAIGDVGDNRASWSIAETVMAGAISGGPQEALAAFEVVTDQGGFGNFVFSESFTNLQQLNKFSENDLKVLWVTLCGITYWSDYSDRERLQKLRDAILRTEFGKRGVELRKYMSDTNPIEFHIEKIAKVSKEEDSGKDFDPSKLENPEAAIEEFHAEESGASISFRTIAKVVDKLGEQRPSNFAELISKVFQKCLNYERQYWWRFAGMDRVYSALFPHLNGQQKWTLGRRILDNFFGSEDRKFFGTLGETLETYCRLALNSQPEGFTSAFDRAYQMHLSWLSGFSADFNLPMITVKDSFAIASWSEFGTSILLKQLSTRSATKVENAIVALGALLSFDRRARIFLTNEWETLNADQQYYLLLLLEGLMIKNPEFFDDIRSCLERANQSPLFAIKCQAYLVFRTLESRASLKFGLPELKANSSLDTLDLVHSPVDRIFETGERTRYINNYHKLFQSRSKMIQSVAGEEAAKAVLNRCSFLLAQRVDEEVDDKIQKSRTFLRGDFAIGRRDNDDLFNSVVEHEKVKGTLVDVPLIALCQFVLTTDEPATLFRPYELYFDIPGWEAQQKKILEAPAEVFSWIVAGGLSDDEVVLGGFIRTYHDKRYYEAAFNSFFLDANDRLVGEKWGCTFNGRSVFAFQREVFHPPLRNTSHSLFIRAGGIGHFQTRGHFMVPNVHIFRELGWSMAEDEKEHIVSNGKIVAKLQKFYGPIPDIGERLDALSVLQRWVCKRDVFNHIAKAFPFRELLMRGTFDEAEVGTY